MKRFLSDTLMRRRKNDTSTLKSNPDYDNAMRVYKVFAYVSGAVVTLAYVISLLL